MAGGVAAATSGVTVAAGGTVVPPGLAASGGIGGIAVGGAAGAEVAIDDE
jgi:hypothetical protein